VALRGVSGDADMRGRERRGGGDLPQGGRTALGMGV